MMEKGSTMVGYQPLDHHPNFKLDPFPNPLTGELTNGQLQIWPWNGPGDAMFIARFLRLEE